MSFLPPILEVTLTETKLSFPLRFRLALVPALSTTTLIISSTSFPFCFGVFKLDKPGGRVEGENDGVTDVVGLVDTEGVNEGVPEGGLVSDGDGV